MLQNFLPDNFFFVFQDSFSHKIQVDFFGKLCTNKLSEMKLHLNGMHIYDKLYSRNRICTISLRNILREKKYFFLLSIYFLFNILKEFVSVLLFQIVISLRFSLIWPLEKMCCFNTALPLVQHRMGHNVPMYMSVTFYGSFSLLKSKQYQIWVCRRHQPQWLFRTSCTVLLCLPPSM